MDINAFDFDFAAHFAQLIAGIQAMGEVSVRSETAQDNALISDIIAEKDTLENACVTRFPNEYPKILKIHFHNLQLSISRRHCEDALTSAKHLKELIDSYLSNPH
jgi:hypothetical protein